MLVELINISINLDKATLACVKVSYSTFIFFKPLTLSITINAYILYAGNKQC